VGIVTNKRIIDIDFYGLIYKEITSAKLEKIEDITVKSGGFFASIFNYGNIFIQTAGTEVNIEFFNVPSPNKVRDLINSLTTEKQ
jgi:membrane protein YdbS with pleckstrin-like domain